MNFFYSRGVSFCGFLLCCFLLGFAAYLQLRLGLLPCPLCVVQRVVVLLIGVTFLVGALYTPPNPVGKKFHSAVLAFFSVVGVFVAARHVWLTLQPSTGPTTCSPTLEYMFKHLAFTDTLKVLLLGTDDCAKDTWRMMGLNIPEWTLIFFVGVTVFAVMRYMVARNEKRTV
ncbi:MAG TPA: disulfide bond formation protein B [Gammaproteobacteria bacterium]|nr:disulfide bond formation protein B [Gammaproteobacteria bacterium]